MSTPINRRPPNAGVGKRPGTLNHVTREVRDCFRMLLENNVDKLQGWLDRVAVKDPGKALDMVAKLAEFVTPKLARTEVRLPRPGALIDATAPITDATEASRIYAEILGNPGIDLAGITFAVPALPGPVEAVLAEAPAEPLVQAPALPPEAEPVNSSICENLGEPL